jgi:hypothetical protein
MYNAAQRKAPSGVHEPSHDALFFLTGITVRNARCVAGVLCHEFGAPGAMHSSSPMNITPSIHAPHT